jgi:esterase
MQMRFLLNFHGPIAVYLRALDEGSQMSYLQNFYYQITGPDQAPKMVFLHGVMGFTANWRRIAREFEKDYQVLVFDQRGHGRSFHPSGYAPEDYAEDLNKILDELGWQKITLVGHSLGGRVALIYADLYPEKVTRLVIEDIGPSMNEIGSERIIKLVEAVPVPFVNKKAAKEFFETRFLDILKNNSKAHELSQYLYANIKEDEQKRGVWRFSKEGVIESVKKGRDRERWSEIKGLKIPVLLVRGERSEDLPRDVFEKVLKANPKIQGVEIEGAGHWVHSDQPEQFVKTLKQFLGHK